MLHFVGLNLESCKNKLVCILCFSIIFTNIYHLRGPDHNSIEKLVIIIGLPQSGTGALNIQHLLHYEVIAISRI